MNRAPVAADFSFPSSGKRVSHIVLSFMVCVKNCRRRFGSRINPDPDNITLSSGLKPVPGFERMPPSLCLRDRGLEGSKGAGYDDSATADQLISYIHAGMKNKKSHYYFVSEEKVSELNSHSRR